VQGAGEAEFRRRQCIHRPMMSKCNSAVPPLMSSTFPAMSLPFVWSEGLD
jgi:hypothetical protein